MAARPKLSNKAARRYFMHRHGLCENAKSLAGVFDQLGFVQVDSISTVARAHHMIIHARYPRYRQGDLARFVEIERGAFEHWTHDASIVAIAHYPYWKLRFERAAKALPLRWSKDRRDGFLAVIPDILQQIERSGPTCSSDVGTEEKKSSGGWWDWHPSKTALEFLWRTGALAVSHRRGFRKFYDLPDRVIPKTHLGATPSVQETIDWACQTAVNSLGFATSGEIAAFLDKVTPAEARKWCAQQQKQGALIEVDIEAFDGGLRPSFARPDALQAAQNAPAPSRQIRILSPFDPVLRDRDRTLRLFGFHYRIEVFVPAAKRQYGYYVFPVLEGDTLIGRIDMKADAKTGQLTVTRFWQEDSIKMGSGRRARIKSAIERTGRLADAKTTIYAPGWLGEAQRQ